MESDHPTDAAASSRTEDSATSSSVVTAHTTCEDRVVFTERDNVDGWISTDIAVDVHP